MEIDGYAFCLGVGSINLYNADPDLQRLIRSVTYLIEGAIFRPGYATTRLGRSSLDICPLSELIDMYHTHEATERHDKVYALLGMSSDDLSKASLSPNYRLPWEEVFRDVVKFLLHDKISVEILGLKQTALIKSKGCLLGKVSLVQSDIASGDSQGIHVIFKNSSRQPRYMEGCSAPWTLHTSAKSIQDGDFICLLQGALKPLIVRLCDGHFDIVLITATPPEAVIKSLQSTRTLYRNITLIWDWGKLPRELKDLGQYEILLKTEDLESEHSKIEFESHLEKATRRWNFAMVLEGLGEDEIVQDEIKKAIEGYERTAAEGDEDTVNQLLKTGEINVDFEQKNGTTLLWWAAKAGHDAMVKLLLGTGGVNIDAKDKNGTTTLQVAAAGGYLAIVERLLQEKADVNAAAGSGNGRTALQAVAGGGHLAVVERLLLEKADVNAAAGSGNGRTALQAAAGGGHLAVVERLLLEKADVNAVAGSGNGRTALQAAAEGGHLAVVERLLQEKADVNVAAGSGNGRTALQAAAGGGHLAVVERLLLEKADVNAAAAADDGRTALQAAAGGGHLAVVERLLLEKADVDAAAGGHHGMTALQAAAKGGHLAVVECLREQARLISMQRTVTVKG
jgi:ankyrin repeat protein